MFIIPPCSLHCNIIFGEIIGSKKTPNIPDAIEEILSLCGRTGCQVKGSKVHKHLPVLLDCTFPLSHLPLSGQLPQVQERLLFFLFLASCTAAAPMAQRSSAAAKIVPIVCESHVNIIISPVKYTFQLFYFAFLSGCLLVYMNERTDKEPLQNNEHVQLYRSYAA